MGRPPPHPPLPPHLPHRLTPGLVELGHGGRRDPSKALIRFLPALGAAHREELVDLQQSRRTFGSWGKPLERLVSGDQLGATTSIADRVRAHDFYRDGLGLDAIGELADDGVPEPLMFVLNPMARLMLVPTGGFGWVIGDHRVAEPGTSECVLDIGAATDDDVDRIVERARNAGATVATEPAPQPWGYAAAFADPDGHIWTVTSARLPN